jgi:hypothetical protein
VNEVIDLDGLDPAGAFLCLMPYMAHPADQRRRQLVEAYLLGRLYKGAALTLPEDALPTLVEAAATGVGADFVEARYHGAMAGEVLLTVLHLHAAACSPGLDRAQHIVSEWYRQTPSSSGRRFRASRDTVRGAWRAFRDVAHLWAAWSLVRRVDGDQVALDGLRVAAVAAGLAREAEAVRTPSGEPVLPPTLFMLSVAPATVMPPNVLSPGMLEALQVYRPRNA